VAKVPKFRFPFSVIGGSVAVVEQDSAREVAQCVHATLNTPLGSRLEAPEYGRPAGLFDQVGDVPRPEAYLAAVRRDEPRAQVLAEGEIEGMVERIAFREELQGV
jgi:phage baseplate assembly protein W